jgi:hypothetical protein
MSDTNVLPTITLTLTTTPYAIMVPDATTSTCVPMDTGRKRTVSVVSDGARDVSYTMLPDEIWSHILRFVPSTNAMSRTCRYFYTLIDNDMYLWRCRIRDRWPLLEHLDELGTWSDYSYKGLHGILEVCAVCECHTHTNHLPYTPRQSRQRGWLAQEHRAHVVDMPRKAPNSTVATNIYVDPDMFVGARDSFGLIRGRIRTQPSGGAKVQLSGLPISFIDPHRSVSVAFDQEAVYASSGAGLYRFTHHAPHLTQELFRYAVHRFLLDHPLHARRVVVLPSCHMTHIGTSPLFYAHQVALLDVATKQTVTVFGGHTDRVMALAARASSDSVQEFLTGSKDATACIWDVRVPTAVARIATGIRSCTATAVADQYVVAGREIQFWDRRTHRCPVRRLTAPQFGVKKVVCNQHVAMAQCYTQESTVHVWDISGHSAPSGQSADTGAASQQSLTSVEPTYSFVASADTNVMDMAPLGIDRLITVDYSGVTKVWEMAT